MLKWEDPDHTGNDHGLAIDDVTVAWTTVNAPAITGAATATPFTTIYGTASAAQTFAVSGVNLTADLTATAPTGFEVASDGATYGATATFTQSGGNASGTLSVRLKANAAVSGSYDSQNIVLSSTGASPVNITTAASGNTVSPKALSVTASAQIKTYGTVLSLGSSLFTSSGLENSETIGVVTLTASGGTAAADAVGGYTITPSAATGGTFNAANYSITYNAGTLTVNAKALTITANDVTKPFGATLTGGAGSTAFTSSGLANSETIGSVTITYGTGAASSDAAGTYPSQITASAATGGTFSEANYSIAYVPGTITVTADPTITTVGTLAAVDTTYGTASAAPASFSVSGVFLTGDLTVTPPTGFEVSTNVGSDYATTLTLSPSGGTLDSTTVHVRLAATTAAGNYSGDVTVSGGGATSQTVATALSTVAQKALTITGLTGGNKVYDRTLTASVAGTAALSGVVAGDEPNLSLDGTPSATFATFTVGTAKPLTVTGYSISGSAAANYSLTQPVGLAGDITPLDLTVTGATVTSRAYNGTTAATITGATLVGVISPDVVTVSGGGTFADVNAANGIAVTAALALGGADAGNYSLIQPTGLTGDITPAGQTITFAALADKTIGDAPFALGATASSGLAVTYVSSAPAVATVSGNTVTIVGVGTTTITASQAGNGNYTAAADVLRTLTVTAPLLAAWDVSPLAGGTGVWGASPLAATTVAANTSVGGLTRGSGVSTPAGSAAAARAWGGLGWNYSSSANAIAANVFATFTVAANNGFTISLNSISKFGYRRSSTGATTGLVQYKLGSGSFTDITTVSYPTTTSGGDFVSPIDLSGISALQNVPAGTVVTFRIVNFGASGSGGTWYVFDVANSTAPDFEVTGYVNCVAPTASLSGDAAICAGSSANLPTVLTGVAPWNVTWSDGITSNNVTASPLIRTVSPGATTTYTLTSVSDSGSCGAGTVSGGATITVNPLPTVSVNSATICAGGSTTLTATTDASNPSYLWSPGGETTAAITVSPATTTVYSVIVTDGTTACANNAAGTVTINPLPTVSVNSATICAGASTILTATTDASNPSYLWSPGGATTASITVSPATTTVYSVIVTDGATTCANGASGTVTVNPLPTVTVEPATTNAECGSTVTFAASPAGDGPLTYQWFDNLTNAIAGETNLTLTVTNMHGNAAGYYTVVVTGPFCNASAVAALSVVDTLAPALTVLGANPATNECHAAYTDAGVMATDACVGSVSVSTNNLVNADVPGVYTVTYTSDDGNGNTNTATRTVYVADTLAPVLTVLGANPATNECHVAYVDAGVTASDACAGSVSVSTNSTLEANVPGVYTITYTSDDGNGNTNTATRTVYVTDTVAPVITYYFTNLTLSASGGCQALMPDVTGTNYLLAEDACGAVTIAQMPTNNAVLSLGTNEVVLAVADSAGNTAYSTNTVVVVDATGPVVTLLGDNPLVVECHAPFIDPGASANDNCSGVVAVTTNLLVNADVPGNYTIEYLATDFAGNSTTNTRIVNVVDTVAPALTILGANPTTNECHAAYLDAGATALDACGGSVGVSANLAVDSNTPGVYVVTYTADDGNGNTNTATRTVYVTDTVAPVITYYFTNLTLSASGGCQALMPDVTGTNYLLAEDAAVQSRLPKCRPTGRCCPWAPTKWCSPWRTVPAIRSIRRTPL
ncbi:MAG: DUF5011 domain-containing protein [Verrucomicrobiota bacterium]